MLNFTADPRDGYKYSAGCNTCCCETIHMKPGETNLLRIHYAGWVIPLMGRGLTANTWFELTKIAPPDSGSDGNTAPVITGPARYNTLANTLLDDTLTTFVDNLGPETLTFKLLGMYGPNHGEMVVEANGDFTYTPINGYNGLDTFYYQVSDGFNVRVGFGTVGVGTGQTLDTVVPDKVSVARGRKTVDNVYHTMSVPITVDPTALPGDIYRLNVRQEAVDCDGNPFYHISCYDVIVGKC
jgi:hypothetical protein